MPLNKREQQKLVNAVAKLPKKIKFHPEHGEEINYFWGSVAKYLDHYFKGKKPPQDYPRQKQELLELYVKRCLAFYDACFFGWKSLEQAPIEIPFDSPLSGLKWLLFIEAEQHSQNQKALPWRSLRTYAPLRYLHRHKHLPAKEKKKADAALKRIKAGWSERDRDRHQCFLDVLQLIACDDSAQDAVREFLKLDDEMFQTMAELSQHRNLLYRT
jgi:hypothetical protein